MYIISLVTGPESCMATTQSERLGYDVIVNEYRKRESDYNASPPPKNTLAWTALRGLLIKWNKNNTWFSKYYKFLMTEKIDR